MSIRINRELYLNQSLRRSLLLIFVTILSLYPVLLNGQNFFNSFKIDHWDTKSGLPNDLIMSVYQSKDGYIWLNSFAGLTRFDGISFITFNSRTVPVFKSDNIELVYEGEDSTLWIPSQSKGLIGFKQGVFTMYAREAVFSRIVGTTAEKEILFYSGIPRDPVLAFNTETKTGTLLRDSLVSQLYMAGKIFKANSRDRLGMQWRIVSGKMARIQPDKIFILTEKEGIRPGFLFHEPFVDSQSRVWVPTTEGLLLWNGTRMEAYPGMENKAFFVIANTRSGLIMEDKMGGIWAAYSGGLAYLAPGALRFEFVPEKHALHSVNITYLMEDKEGSVWASSENGLYKLSQSKFKNYSVQEGLSNNRVAAVAALDTQQYLVATSRDGRLFRIDHGRVSPFQYKNGEYNQVRDEVFHIYVDSRKNIWICGQRQTIRISGNTEKRMANNLAVRHIYEDENNKLWFGLPFQGIAFLNNKDELEFANYPGVDFKSLFITSIRKLNEDWLVTSANRGVWLINPQGVTRVFNDSLGLGTNVVYNAYEESDGICWVATNLGVFRFKSDSFAQVKFSEGLPENALFTYLPDHLGNVWFPSNRGIVRARKQDLFAQFEGKIKTVDWRLFDDGDGMRNRQGTGARFSAISPDGRLLIPTMGGLVEVDPSQIPENRIPPSVVIHRILRDGNTVDLTQRHHFKPGNHRYLFEFSGLSLVAPEKVQFKFKLIGYDKDWLNSNFDRRAFYTNIPRGQYTFQVIACNNDGVWNETGARYEFTVLSFFYETIWFRSIAMIFLFLFIWFVIRWRTASTRKQNELLERQVAVRTLELNKANDELNQTNAAIASQRDNLEQTLRELKTAQSQLIQSEKMASLGELTAGIAHEIQNPLNFINNFSDVNRELIEEVQLEITRGNFREAGILMNEIRGNEQKIINHGKRADSIVKGMLQHSRANSGEKVPTDLNSLIDEYMRICYHGFRAKDKTFNVLLKTDFDPGLRKISIVPQDIGRVILNLLTNAFDAVKDKKRQQPENYEPAVLLSTRREGGQVVIRVKDNGNGIPETIREKIFQPFFTTKPSGQGTGLGLSLAYDIIKAHNGDLLVESRDGEYSEFILQLPVNH